MSYIVGQVDIDGPECGNVWRNAAGDVRGTVNIAPGLRDYITFTSPADARAVAAACLECAEAMERLESEGGGVNGNDKGGNPE